MGTYCNPLLMQPSWLTPGSTSAPPSPASHPAFPRTLSQAHAGTLTPPCPDGGCNSPSDPLCRPPTFPVLIWGFLRPCPSPAGEVRSPTVLHPTLIRSRLLDSVTRCLAFLHHRVCRSAPTSGDGAHGPSSHKPSRPCWGILGDHALITSMGEF